jgi:pantetheine-phosphate adenylyltransferase
VDLVKRALPLFDKIYVAVGVNNSKQSLFPLEKRIDWLQRVFKGIHKIEIETFEGLTVNYAEQKKAGFLLRGLRNASDFDYEKTISQLNHIIGDNLETLFLISKPEFSHISSTIVREIIKGKGNVAPFIPEAIAQEMYHSYNH